MLFNNKKLLRSQFTFKSDHHKIYTQKINKIVLNYFDDKRIQCNDKITAYPYGYFDNKKDINMKIKIIPLYLMQMIIVVSYLKIIILRTLLKKILLVYP